MPSFKVAHLREQGHDMIVVPVDLSFSRQSSSDQNAFIAELQQAAIGAGLRGTVVPVWSGGFIAPRPWHPFFKNFTVHRVQANINREISW